MELEAVYIFENILEHQLNSYNIYKVYNYN